MLVFSVIFSNFLCAPSNWDPIVDHPKWSYAKVNHLLLASKKHESYNQKKGHNLAVQFYLNIHFLLQRFYTNYQKQVDSICRFRKGNQKQHQHLRTSPVPLHRGSKEGCKFTVPKRGVWQVRRKGSEWSDEIWFCAKMEFEFPAYIV